MHPTMAHPTIVPSIAQVGLTTSTRLPLLCQRSAALLARRPWRRRRMRRLPWLRRDSDGSDDGRGGPQPSLSKLATHCRRVCEYRQYPNNFEVKCSSRFDCHFPAQSPRLFSGHLRWLSSASAGTLIQVHHQLSQFVLVARDVVRADAQVSAPCLHSIAVVKGSVELGNSRNHTIAHAPCFACHQNVTQLSV